MTHKKFLGGTLALGMAFMMALAGCEDGTKDDDNGGGGGGGASANYIAKQPADVQDYDGYFFASRSEAITAFTTAVSYSGSFASMLNDAYNNAQAAPYAEAMAKFAADGGMDKTSGSISYSVADTTVLQTEANVTAASISGSNSASFGGNVKQSDISNHTWKEGDTRTSTSGNSFTMNISQGFYSFTSSNSYKVAGILEYSGNGSNSRSYTRDAEGGLVCEFGGSGESSGGVLLTIDNVSSGKGGKFKMSYASKWNENGASVSRHAASTDSYDETNLQVYDNTGELKYTIYPNELHFASFYISNFFEIINR